mmetsp:Transcript_19732/g.35151  ORF Transcript_19732/g.35151 Transcript_19732/m.35151 type:complete len:86 (+) Transcript_19732:22-279(+)
MSRLMALWQIASTPYRLASASILKRMPVCRSTSQVLAARESRYPEDPETLPPIAPHPSHLVALQQPGIASTHHAPTCSYSTCCHH